MKTYRIFIINPGSTSTKFSLFENDRCVFTEDTFHDSAMLMQFPTFNDQLDFRMNVSSVNTQRSFSNRENFVDVEPGLMINIR